MPDDVAAEAQQLRVRVTEQEGELETLKDMVRSERAHVDRIGT